jgi:hypothetical protein
MKVLQQSRPALALAQRILVVGDRNSLLRRQRGDIATYRLVGFASIAYVFTGTSCFRGFARGFGSHGLLAAVRRRSFFSHVLVISLEG